MKLLLGLLAHLRKLATGRAADAWLLAALIFDATLPGAAAAVAAPLSGAAHLWTFADNAGMRRNGEVKTGVRLEPADRPAAHERSGEDRVAVFQDGYLDAAPGQIPAFPIHADFTVAARFHLDAVYFDFKERHDAVLMEWVGRDTAEKPGRHSLSLEVLSIGHVRDNRYLGLFLDNHFINVSLRKLQSNRWQDVVLRVRRNVAELFINGDLLARKDLGRQAMVGSTRAADLVSDNFLRLGRNRRGDLPWHGMMAHLAVWNTALDDSAVAAISGAASLNTAWKQPMDWGQNWAGYYEEDITLEEAYRRMFADSQHFYRRALREDIYFPRFHLVTPGFMTEPSMSSYKKDAYHIFPHGHLGWRGITYEEGHYWHHLYSRDLLQWRLMPLPEWREPESGNIIEADGKAVSFPSRWPERGISQPAIPQLSVQTGKSYLERWSSTDPDLATWRPEKHIPVQLPSSGIWPMNNFVFRYEGRWYMVASYAGRARLFPHTEGLMELYRGTDNSLDNWEYVGVFYRGSGWTSHHPRIFFLGGKTIMSSDLPIDKDVEYLLGRIENERFVREGGGTYHFGYPSISWGGSVTEQNGRVLYWALIRGMSSEVNLLSDTVRRGWQNAYSLPRVAGLKGERLTFDPAPELQALRRGKLHSASRMELQAGGKYFPEHGGTGGQFEVRCKVKPGTGGAAGIVLKADDDDVVRFYYDATKGRLVLDFKQARYGGKGGIQNGLHQSPEVPCRVEPGAELELRLFFDRSVIEVYADGLVSVGRWYPRSPDQVRVGFFADNAKAAIADMDLWSLGTIWEEYLTSGTSTAMPRRPAPTMTSAFPPACMAAAKTLSASGPTPSGASSPK